MGTQRATATRAGIFICIGGVDKECAQGGAGGGEEAKVGRRRQVNQILVLQLGIMIHSLVIGLTLSITTGSEFSTSFRSVHAYMRVM